MKLTRRIAADDVHHGQDVFECSACRVAMTQGSPVPQLARRR